MLKELWNGFVHRWKTQSDERTGPYEAYHASRKVPKGTPLCLAPWSSLSFNVDGTANICCLNGKTVVDTVGKTIDEVWNSPEVETLRNKVLSGDLSYDCSVCQQNILNRNFDGVKAIEYDNYHPTTPDFPQVMEFCLDNTCNLECVMCNSILSSSIRKRKGLTPHKRVYGDEFVSQLDKYIPHLKEAVFVGGEPFLIPIYYRMWEKMIELNPEMTIGVVTNGTILNEKVKQAMERGKFKITVSLDSADNATYTAIRKNAEYKKVIENFGWFRDYCKQKGTSMNIATCPMTNNWESIPDTVRFANRNGAFLSFAHVQRPLRLSLIHAEQPLLNQIIECFEGQEFEPSKTSGPNINRFKGLIAELKTWKDANSRPMPEFSESVDMNQLEEMLLSAASDEQGRNTVLTMMEALNKLEPQDRRNVARSIGKASAKRVLTTARGMTGNQVTQLLLEATG